MIKTNFEDSIGKNIREVRRSLGYSQEKLANLCGISSSTLSAYENSRKIPNVNTIAKIAKALGISIDRLYYGDENTSFVTSVPDEGRKIVNCVYVLWELEVIRYYESYTGTFYAMENHEKGKRRGVFLEIIKYPSSVRRLINSLNEFKTNKKTYAEPEKYLEILLASVAAEINQEIEQGK